jgi:hypothetical protein
MISYDRKQLIELKPGFLKWHREHWCDCGPQCVDDCADPEEAKEFCDPPNDCCCYGRDEYDDVWKAVVDDTSIRIYYAHEANPEADHQRQLILPFDDAEHPPHECNDGLPLFNRRLAGSPYIKSGDLEWVGDDVDYMGPIIYYIQHLLGGK